MLKLDEINDIIIKKYKCLSSSKKYIIRVDLQNIIFKFCKFINASKISKINILKNFIIIIII